MTFSSMYPSSRSSKPRRRVEAPLESPSHLALIGLIVLLVGLIVHPLAALVPLGVLVLALAGLATLVRPARRTMYWRGRELDLDDHRGGLREVYYLIFRR